ncbi:MAG: SDR family NAD(P)-dependent oxidoreductase [Coraliomargaritaceae bacterium]
MKKNLRRFLEWLKKIPFIFSSIRKSWRYGGITTVNLTKVSNGEVLRGKRILVTGGSSGIGLSIAKRFIEERALVAITGRDSAKLQGACRSIGSESLEALVWDISDTSQIGDKLSETEALLGGELDILINNAGILSRDAFPCISSKEWDRVYAVNSKGLFFLTQAISKKWLNSEQQATRKIINISSQGGFVGATYPYRMTKWDIVGLTQGLGAKLAPHGILVNALAPGIIATDMQKRYLQQQDNLFCVENPVRRVALPEEVAELALFIASDCSNFIVGQTIVCDGGYSIK